MAEDKESKTEQPTEKKLKDTREKGRSAKSQEVNTVVILIASTVFFIFLGWFMIERVLLIWREYFMASAQFDFTPNSAQYLLRVTLTQLLYVLLPLMGSLAAVGVISNYWQNDGWMFSWNPLQPKFSKLNPLNGVKKIIGKEGFMNLFKSLGKLALISVAIYLALDDEWALIPILMESSVIVQFQILGEAILELMIKVLLVLLIIAIIDFSFQKYQFIENLKMTKQEVRDERKQMEGDPLVKQRQRQKAFEMFRGRMMAAVPEAEVIITNPTHLSIALRYDRLNDPAPVVIAKGSGQVALKIREIAKENDIPIIEDKPLARTLFKSVDIGEYVPETLYKAVAEILAYVYKLKVNTFDTKSL